ncbi:MAG: hypothetical protein MRY74_06215 [Neomegalonema sp.]|nr:hypothetical protein [Neomegalonema sp.]
MTYDLPTPWQLKIKCFNNRLKQKICTPAGGVIVNIAPKNFKATTIFIGHDGKMSMLYTNPSIAFPTPPYRTREVKGGGSLKFSHRDSILKMSEKSSHYFDIKRLDDSPSGKFFKSKGFNYEVTYIVKRVFGDGRKEHHIYSAYLIDFQKKNCRGSVSEVEAVRKGRPPKSGAVTCTVSPLSTYSARKSAEKKELKRSQIIDERCRRIVPSGPFLTYGSRERAAKEMADCKIRERLNCMSDKSC